MEKDMDNFAPSLKRVLFLTRVASLARVLLLSGGPLPARDLPLSGAAIPDDGPRIGGHLRRQGTRIQACLSSLSAWMDGRMDPTTIPTAARHGLLLWTDPPARFGHIRR